MLNENVKGKEFPRHVVNISTRIVDNYVEIEENDTGFTEISLENSIDIVMDFIGCLPSVYQKKILEILGNRDQIEFIKDQKEGLRDNESYIDEESKEIKIFYRDNIGDVFHIVHEIWHKIFLNNEIDTENELLENPIILEYSMYDYLKKSDKYKMLDEDLDRYMIYRYQENYQYAIEILFKNALISLYRKNHTLNRGIVEDFLEKQTSYKRNFRNYYEEKFNFVEGGHVFDDTLLFQYILLDYASPTIIKEEDSISKVIQISENFLTDDRILDKVIGNLEDNNLIDNYVNFYEKIISCKSDKKRR